MTSRIVVRRSIPVFILLAASLCQAQVADNAALQQQEWKGIVARNLRLFSTQFQGTVFGAAVNLGDPMVLHRRLMKEDLALAVDPAKIANEKATALFMLWDHRIVLKASPEFYPVSVAGRSTDNYRFIDIWHELNHAVMHEMEHESMAARLAVLSEKDDEMYIEWAEDAVDNLDTIMRRFEQYIQRNGKIPPSASVAAKGRNGWTQFLKQMATPRGKNESRLPTEQEKEEFKRFCGFDVNPQKIKAHYLALGYSPLYFDEGSPANNVAAAEPRILDGVWTYNGRSVAEARQEENGDLVFKAQQNTLTVEWWLDFGMRDFGHKARRIATYELILQPNGFAATLKGKNGDLDVIEALWKGKDLEGRFYHLQPGETSPAPEATTLFRAFGRRADPRTK